MKMTTKVIWENTYIDPWNCITRQSATVESSSLRLREERAEIAIDFQNINDKQIVISATYDSNNDDAYCGELEIFIDKESFFRGLREAGITEEEN